MKKNIVWAMLLIVSANSFSQQTNPPSALTKQDYLQKSKKQKTAARVLSGGGIVLTGTGFLMITGNESSFFDARAGVFIGGLGFLATIISIPLFIASGKNKRKGRSLSFKNETAPQIQKSSFVYRPVPSVTLKISL